MKESTTLRGEKYQTITGAFLLAAIVLALYWPVKGYDFIALDDNLYIVENTTIQKGISLQTLSWAMTTFYTTNWHPFTWLTYMSDFQLFGLNPAGYHLGNLALHLISTILLFFLMKRMTGEIWKGGAVAALFAVHPLNIESVAWIAERKNLLSTLFWILTIMAYIRYTQNPGWKRYSLILVSFIMGLMAKPVLVTLPFVLLLLDYWPLSRFQWLNQNSAECVQEKEERRRILIRLLFEKMPLFFLSLLSAITTFYAARSGGAVKTISAFPLAGRIENAVISYVMYLYKMVWPADLAIFYPYPVGRPVWQVALSLLFLTAVTVFICTKRRKYRYLFIGWFWYVIALLPSIGLVQVGFQSMANRYAYIPLIGIFIIIAWGVPDLLKPFSCRCYIPVLAIAIILAYAFSVKMTLPNWKNSELVFKQALNVTKNNHIAEMGMGNVRLGRGDLDKARYHFKESLRIKPDYAEAHNNLAIVLMREGKANDAANQYREALRDNPDYAEAHNNLGVILAGQHKWREAEDSFRNALRLKPDYSNAQSNLNRLFLDEKNTNVSRDAESK
jgi:protein O-mannosyl-transferase